MKDSPICGGVFWRLLRQAFCALSQAFFDYGNVIVQTAGTEPVFLFQSVPKPQQIVRIIHQLLERQEET